MADEAHIQRPAWFPFADALHRAVVEFRRRRNPALAPYDDADGEFLAMGFGGEAGEVLNEFKKRMRGDYSHAEFLVKVSAELADARCMLELVARAVGVDLDEVTPRKLEDFEQKLIRRGWIPGPVATRPSSGRQERIFMCSEGHETAVNYHPIMSFACQHKIDGQGSPCGAVAQPKVR